jgi:hypothetical protein
MTVVTDAAAAAVRARAVDEARAAQHAVRRARARMGDAAEAVVLRGQGDWLGPAREAFDERCRRLRDRLAAEEHELALLVLSIKGAL